MLYGLVSNRCFALCRWITLKSDLATGCSTTFRVTCPTGCSTTSGGWKIVEIEACLELPNESVSAFFTDGRALQEDVGHVRAFRVAEQVL